MEAALPCLSMASMRHETLVPLGTFCGQTKMLSPASGSMGPGETCTTEDNVEERSPLTEGTMLHVPERWRSREKRNPPRRTYSPPTISTDLGAFEEAASWTFSSLCVCVADIDNAVKSDTPPTRLS